MQSNGYCLSPRDVERMTQSLTHQHQVARKCSVRLCCDICQAICFAFKLEYQIVYGYQWDGDVSETRGPLGSR